jgi:hypothetical protein
MRVVKGLLLSLVGSTAVVVVCMAIGGAASVGAGRAGHPPDVIQLSYSETSGDTGADKFLGVFARHTRAVHFATTKHRVKARAPGRYRPDITDTDLHGRKARHPWTPDRKEGGSAVIAMVHQALKHRGHIAVRVRARNAGVVDDVRVHINRKRDCTSDPPAYPIDCEVKVD